jgi:plastocyanin
MAHAGQAPQASAKKVTIKIKNDGTVDLPTASANVGDTVEFHNEASSSKVVQFLDDDALMAIALEIPNGGRSNFLATVEGTVDYTIGLGSAADRASFSPDDDTYQVIVGSSNLDM